jgi:hypothetical protein
MASSASAGLARACNLASVTTKRELFQKIGNRFTGRQESGLDSTISLRSRDPTEQAQRLGQTVAQIDLEDTFAARLNPVAGTFPGGSKCIEPDGYGSGARLIGNHKLPKQIQQQIDLEIEPQQLGGDRRRIVILFRLTMFFDGGAGLQHVQIPFTEAADDRRIKRLKVRPPDEGQHVFIRELFVKDDGIGALVHGTSPQQLACRHRTMGSGKAGTWIEHIAASALSDSRTA